MAGTKIAHPAPNSQALALQVAEVHYLSEVETGVEIVPASGLDAGLVRYVLNANPQCLERLEYQAMEQGAGFEESLFNLCRDLAPHLHEPGKKLLFKRMAHEITRAMDRPQVIKVLCWIARENLLQGKFPPPAEKPKRRRTLDPIFNDSDSRDGALSYAEQHNSMLLYDRHGCRDCKEHNGPHFSGGLCTTCYHRWYQRYLSLIEGHRAYTYKAKKPVRCRVSSPLLELPSPQTAA